MARVPSFRKVRSARWRYTGRLRSAVGRRELSDRGGGEERTQAIPGVESRLGVVDPGVHLSLLPLERARRRIRNEGRQFLLTVLSEKSEGVVVHGELARCERRRVLGETNDGALHAWLEPTMELAFRGEHFDSSEFLLTRKHDGLAELRTELLVRLGELRLQLVNLINDEYQAFISLSTGLRGVKPNLDNLEFGDLLDVAQTVKLDLQRERERVGVLLEQRKGCRGTRDTLDVLRQIHHLLEGNNVKDSTTLVQLIYLLEQATPSKFTTVLSHRIDALRTSLINGLNEQLVHLLQLESKDPAELARLLDTYTTIDSDPTPLVITHLITPALAKLVTTTSLVPPSTLAALYDSLLSLSTSLHHTLPSSYLHLIWSSIATTLVDKLAPTLFQAGQPNQFHLHYSLSVSFIEQLGQSIPGVQETEEARAFMKRFQLMVYFQLRLKQIIQLVTSPSLPASQSGEDQGEDFMLEESRQFWKGIRMIYDDSVHLPELGARFWRLFLQVLLPHAFHRRGTDTS